MAPLQCWKNPTVEKAGGKKKKYREGSGFRREERGDKHIQNLSYVIQIISEATEVTKGGFGDNNLGQFVLVQGIYRFLPSENGCTGKLQAKDLI